MGYLLGPLHALLDLYRVPIIVATRFPEEMPFKEGCAFYTLKRADDGTARLVLEDLVLKRELGQKEIDRLLKNDRHIILPLRISQKDKNAYKLLEILLWFLK